MSLEDLEELNFFYDLHAKEFEKGMIAAQQENTHEYQECVNRMKILSVRFHRAKTGHYSRATR